MGPTQKNRLGQDTMIEPQIKSKQAYLKYCCAFSGLHISGRMEWKWKKATKTTEGWRSHPTREAGTPQSGEKMEKDVTKLCKTHEMVILVEWRNLVPLNLQHETHEHSLK